jgi:phosphatidylethanolamine/phosphatidyl-N-methylethanolamine N-methyltransferase
MPLSPLQFVERKSEDRKRFFGLKKGALGRKIEQQILLFERRRDEFERKIEQHFETRRRKFEQGIETQKRKLESRIRRFEQENGIRIDDEVRFIRSWIEKPLAIGAVTPSSRALARTMASYVDAGIPGPIVELGPGTGPVTAALVARGIDPARLVLVEFNAEFCRLLAKRYPAATVVQGDAYRLRPLLAGALQEPAAAVVSGLPLFTKPLRMRLRLLYEAFALMSPGAPFVQFTYAAHSPIPKRLDRVRSEASERIWANIPPARVWVYRKD